MSVENNAGTAGDGSALPEGQVTDERAAEAGAPSEQGSESEQEGAAEGEQPGGDGSGTEEGTQHRDKTISKLTRNWRATERDRDYWKSVAQRTQAGTPAAGATGQPPQGAPPQEEPLKTLADFEYRENEYQAYLFQRAEQRAVRAAQAELQKEQSRRSATQTHQAYMAKEAEFVRENEIQDFQQTVYREDLPISAAMAQVLMESESGPALAYYLGKNPDIAQVIAQLPPLAAARELGRLESRLAHERETAKPRTVTQAPPPPKKIEGSGSPSVSAKPDTPDSDKLSDAEWARRRNAQVKAKATRR